MPRQEGRELALACQGAYLEHMGSNRIILSMRLANVRDVISELGKGSEVRLLVS